MSRRRPVWLLAVLAAGCIHSPESLLEAGRADEAIAVIRAEPDSYRARYLLSRAHLAAALQALESGNPEQYAERLSAARKEALRAVEIGPLEAPGHNLLGMLAAYQRDLPGAQRSFDIARELEPNEPIYRLNLAELAICGRDYQVAQGHLDEARRLGGSDGLIELAVALAAWRQDDLDTARSIVEPLVKEDPELLRSWASGAPIRSFDEFVSYCERLPFCMEAQPRK